MVIKTTRHCKKCGRLTNFHVEYKEDITKAGRGGLKYIPFEHLVYKCTCGYELYTLCADHELYPGEQITKEAMNRVASGEDLIHLAIKTPNRLHTHIITD